MTSVRGQIIATVMGKLELVKDGLGWKTLIRNPREPVGEDQFNAILLAEGGDEEPDALTGHIEHSVLDFSVGMLVQETATMTAEELLDAGFVAIVDALIDPNDIQLGGIAIGIRRGAMSPPYIGRSAQGARIVGGQSMDFTVQYLAREGDASTAAP